MDIQTVQIINNLIDKINTLEDRLCVLEPPEPNIVGDLANNCLYVFGDETIEYVGPIDSPLNPFNPLPTS